VLIYTALLVIGFAVPGFLVGLQGQVKWLVMVGLALILVIVTGWIVAGYSTSPLEWGWRSGTDVLGLIATSLAFVALPSLVGGAMGGVVVAVAFGLGVGHRNGKDAK
jgi:hypothetical protein